MANLTQVCTGGPGTRERRRSQLEPRRDEPEPEAQWSCERSAAASLASSYPMDGLSKGSATTSFLSTSRASREKQSFRHSSGLLRHPGGPPRSTNRQKPV